MKHVRLPEGQKDQKVSSMGERAHGSNKQVAERFVALGVAGEGIVMSTEGNHGCGFQDTETCQYG